MKYSINREFGMFRFFHPPINWIMLKTAKGILSISPKGMKSSKSLSIIKQKVLCHDGKKINIYIIKPKDYADKLPIILYLHGGGFVFKGTSYHYKLVKEYASRLKCAVVYVDYRLAFDTPFFTSMSDCISAYRYILNNAKSLNLDSKHIFFGGDSAGGYLCLSLIQQCKKEALPLPKKLFLIYPVVDPKMETNSMKVFFDTPMWNSKLNKKMWAIYSKNKEVYAPLEADLSYLPPTYIETAEYDCLHDEGVLLFQKLVKSNVPCTLYETKGTMHGYDICFNAPITRVAREKRIAFLNI